MLPIQRSDNALSSFRLSRKLFVIFPAVLLFAGCASEKWVEVFPVSGTVKFNGQAPSGARITLTPVTPPASEAEAVTPTGGVKPDGSFVVTSYKSGDGAPPGEYVLTIQWFKFDEELQSAGPNIIPDQYGNPKTSPLKITVNAGGPTTLEPINITAAPAKTAGVAKKAF